MKRVLCCLAVLACAPAARAADGPGKFELTVRETAGLRRFGYPVSVALNLGRAATAADRFRLSAAGKSVAGQFRVPAGGDGATVVLDFALSMGPLEKKTYQVEYGPAVAAGPEPAGGMTVEEGKKAFTVASGGMTYVVPRDLRVLLEQVRDRKKEFIAGGVGLFVLVGEKAGERLPVGPVTSSRVSRRGPLAVALRFTAGDAKRSSVLELVFPRSKSWVEATWTLEDQGEVRGLQAAGRLLLQGRPTLIDFGAGPGVYTTLRAGESAALRSAGAGWEVRQGKGEGQLFARSLPGEKCGPAEGWAHVMDRQRCTAAAVADFGRATQADRLAVADQGRLLLERTWARPAKGVKRLRFWLHFVDAPVQVGALTSPQSVLQPPRVEVKALK